MMAKVTAARPPGPAGNSRTSKKSRIASPRKFTLNTEIMMNRPGKTPSHHARAMKLRESARMSPQVGVEGFTPSPRNESPASASMA